ncbi:hypothetical protein BDZ97DRAFT_1920602 [Flammula alnicola]|nr:hypothetical protein BDZ97DRAFT_1920602 [Flammula alnicola]
MSLPVVHLSRTFHISAAHRLHSRRMTAEENHAVFGKCARMHGHNYTFKIVIKGAVEERTGMLLNIDILKQIVQEMIIGPLDHRNIDEDVPFFFDKPSTMENLAVFVWGEVKKGMMKHGVSPDILDEVEIYETRDNALSYKGEVSTRSITPEL